MAEPEQTIDVEEVIRVLVSLGIDETRARTQLAGADNDAERLAETAGLAIESDVALSISDDMPLPVALSELVDGLRQTGLALTVVKNAQGVLVLQLEGARRQAFELTIEPGATPQELVRAVASTLPRTHLLLTAADYEPEAGLPVIALDRGTYVWFSAAVGDGALDRVFVRAGVEAERLSRPESERTTTGKVVARSCEPVSSELNFSERYRWHPPLPAATDVDAAFDRVRSYDPRLAWPAGRSRPPGDDFYELCNALAAAPLARCLATSDGSLLAQLLFRFSLATLVGAHCDMLAARRNPGQSAQGVLGWGQLTWAYFIFDALGASAEAEDAGQLLEHPWVMAQERGLVAARQRPYYDLARYLRTGLRGPTLPRLAELLPLTKRSAWKEPDTVNAALAVHTESLGDQLTHHPLYHAWPATLYGLARRAGAVELLPKDNPFLARPLSYASIDHTDPVVVRLQAQLAGFAALDDAHLPPLLDPLPVIVDVEITGVDGDEVRGHTLLAEHDDAEHDIVAPRAGRDIKPGEVWLLEVQGSRRSVRAQHYADLGDVSCAIALPTGEWLEKA
ncbi:MAG: hypothetical protein ABW321_08640 [Polyangiales bacterium]